MTVVGGDRVSDDDLASWSSAQQEDAELVSPFFRPEFAQIVAAVRADVAVGVVRTETEPAFFPFQRRRFGGGVAVGGRLSDYHGVVGRPPPELDARGLLRGCGLRSWRFDAAVASQEIFRPYHRRARSSPFLDLSRGFEAYVGERVAAGSDQVADVRKQAERLAADAGALRFEAHVGERSALELLIRWKSEQYVRTGAVDIFTFPWVRAVVDRVHATQGSDFAGLLSVLYAADRPVAAHLGLRSSSAWHYWLPAYDLRFAKYSPGLILLLRMAEAAPALGLDRIDLGKGDALYKSRLANGSAQLAAGSVDATPAAAVAGFSSRLGSRLIRKTPLSRRVDVSSTRRAFG